MSQYIVSLLCFHQSRRWFIAARLSCCLHCGFSLLSYFICSLRFVHKPIRVSLVVFLHVCECVIVCLCVCVGCLYLSSCLGECLCVLGLLIWVCAHASVSVSVCVSMYFFFPSHSHLKQSWFNLGEAPKEDLISNHFFCRNKKRERKEKKRRQRTQCSCLRVSLRLKVSKVYNLSQHNLQWPV